MSEREEWKYRKERRKERRGEGTLGGREKGSELIHFHAVASVPCRLAVSREGRQYTHNITRGHILQHGEI